MKCVQNQPPERLTNKWIKEVTEEVQLGLDDTIFTKLKALSFLAITNAY